jgi:hypothetical protein
MRRLHSFCLLSWFGDEAILFLAHPVTAFAKHWRCVSSWFWLFSDVPLKGLSPGLRTPMYPDVAFSVGSIPSASQLAI